MLPRSRRYCCIIGVSASRINSELNQAMRIASLEYKSARNFLPGLQCLRQIRCKYYDCFCSSAQQALNGIQFNLDSSSSSGSDTCVDGSASSTDRSRFVCQYRG